MKAILVNRPFGEENIVFSELPDPVPKKGEILVSVKYAGLNPIDISVIRNKTVYGISPEPHIPGAEAVGIAETDGSGIKKGDRVLLYPRWFDSTCRYCRSGMEHMCENGGIFGVRTNGTYAEKITVPEKMLLKLPDIVRDEDAVSIPVGGLTALHSLHRAHASKGEKLLVYGGSGNTGLFAIILGKRMGLEVSTVSSKKWVSDYGAKNVFQNKESMSGYKGDIVINSLGGDLWKDSINYVSPEGRLVTFGVFTGAEVQMNLARLYTNEISVLGSTGGTLNEMQELIQIMQEDRITLPVDRIFKISDLKDAVKYYPSRQNGRILLKM